ncbi:MAG: DUF3108 domain-containing protein [Betaproteobacteria bacterium]|nr:DUF3108 domain-containing protein [Betaproteobacteria bacterium]
MDFDSIKKILKSNQIKFLWAILASILIHLFLLGGIDLYNPFFLKNSDSLNIVIKSHLESSLKKEEIITKQKSSTPKKNRQINNNSKEKKDSSVKDLNQEIQNNEFNEISLSGEKKEIQYKKVVIDYDVRRSLDGSPEGAARTMYFLGENNQYSIKNEVEAKGFVSLFYWNKLVQTSDGIVTPEGLKPKNYHYQFGSKIDNYAIFDWESKKIITTISGKTSEFDMLEGSQDMLSFMYQFMFEPPLTKMKIFITNGKNYKPYDYSYIGEEIIETEMDKILTMHIAKFNYNNEERIDLWLAKDYRYLPVKIRKTEKDGSILDQTAKKIETETLEP